MQFKVNPMVALEGLHIPTSDKGITYAKKEWMADDKAIKEAEEQLGFKFGTQTKEFFKKYAGLHFRGGDEFIDLKLAIGQTETIFEEDERLKGKKIDRIIVAGDGWGNHLCCDASDKTSWYMHDSNPVFDTQTTKQIKLFAYIEQQYQGAQECHNKKPATEGLDVTSLKFNVTPCVKAGVVSFGASRENTRNAIGPIKFKEFKKTKSQKSPVDDYGFMHIYYNDKERVEGVEFFNECVVSISGKQVMPGKFNEVVEIVRKMDADIKVNKASLISAKLSIGIEASDGDVRSVFIGDKGYYTSDSKEGLDASLEMLDPTKIRDYQLNSMTGYAKFKAFGKECATRVSLHLNTDGTLDKAAFDVYNQVIPKIGSILEKGISIITAGVNDMAWVKEEGKILSESDVKRLFKGVGEIDIDSHRDTDGNYIYPVALVRLVGTAPWDEEHGLDVIIHKGRVLCAALGGDLY